MFNELEMMKDHIRMRAKSMRHTWVMRDPFADAHWFKCWLGHEKIRRSDLYQAYKAGLDFAFEHCQKETEKLAGEIEQFKDCLKSDDY